MRDLLADEIERVGVQVAEDLMEGKVRWRHFCMVQGRMVVRLEAAMDGRVWRAALTWNSACAGHQSRGAGAGGGGLEEMA